jgi:hypothetical protein
MRLVVSNDAGGAEILSSWLLREGLDRVSCVLDGPALQVFARKLGPVPRVSLQEGMARADSLLCGTGWQSTLEFDAMALAGERGLPSIAWLDHWVNYRERFQRADKTVLPDEIWVGDEFALARARELFPRTPVTLAGNPYFDDVRAEAKRFPPRPATGPATVLYVCEPVRQAAYDEHQALALFLERIPDLGVPVERVIVRPHPSDPAGKYAWAAAFAQTKVEIGGTHSLMEEIAVADIVAGLQSMAMVIGLLAGRRVVSCIPPGGAPCVLPFPQIETLAGPGLS